MISPKQREQVRIEISRYCRQLILSQRAVELCETEATPKQEEFLHRVFAEEILSREKNRRIRLMQRAGFPVYKTFEAYDFKHVIRFVSVTELVLKLSKAWKAGTLERLVRELQALDLLILDEWGYVPVDKDGSQLLFRVIADSYESKSLVLTTNLEFSKWGSIFTDDQMAAAMIDRLAHHGHLLLFEGESYRMKHALMRQK